MRSASDALPHLLAYRLIEYPYLLDQVPREMPFEQKLGLLLLFRGASRPLVRLHCVRAVHLDD